MAERRFSTAKLLKQHFPGESPMQVDLAEREQLKNNLRQKLAGMRYVTIQSPHRYRYHENEERAVCDLAIDFPNRYSSYRFKLNVNEQSVLTITYGETEKIISTVDEIVAFAQDCQEIVEQRYIKATKKEKIRELKEKTILAKVKQLAREERFSFYTEPGRAKFKLYIRMDNDQTLTITIPYKEFQKSVSLIRTAILTLRELHQHNVRFRSSDKSPFGRWDQESWITPEMLDKE